MNKFKKKDGYAFNINSQEPDIIGNYYAEFILGEFNITEENFNLSSYRNDHGYSLYSLEKNVSTLQLTYYGLLLENKKN
ncbi:TPA: hypothetical protein ACG3KH_004186 [Clostridioides difficile]